MLRISGIVAAALLLAGCASPAQIASQDDATCRSYGAAPGSQSYVQCRMVQDQRRDQHRRDVANALGEAGQALSNRGRSNSVECTSRPSLMGDSIRTTCD